MKYKLLAVSSFDGANIGDYIQALATSQFLPRVDGFVEREKLRDYDGDSCRMIMNGWYQHDPTQWPPSEKIDPLFLAVHFNSTAKDVLLSASNLKYLKQHEPIGCRDIFTSEMLCQRGVNAYFSGCMTLTLGYKYYSKEKIGTVCFVDSYFVTHWNTWTTIQNAFYLFTHFRKIKHISSKHTETKKGLRKMMILTTFFREYRKFFTDETLLEAEYICQQSKFWKQGFENNNDRLAEAERLVRKYSKASLVVTSRIHCALPCLGLETPVIYVENKQQSEASACRFKGLRELFTILQWDNDHLIPEFDYKGKISVGNNIPENKQLWKPLAMQLIKTCKEWLEIQ